MSRITAQRTRIRRAEAQFLPLPHPARTRALDTLLISSLSFTFNPSHFSSQRLLSIQELFASSDALSSRPLRHLLFFFLFFFNYRFS
ncbi:Bgt-20131 [Blumeria graminis f. sp. tritici]|uniref:Bgt-20131 n=2 Tax=Blumeria graminis f. sp. tritici TaxID=62690 RepID=A0A381L6A1_BLUGR|nr:Bgt-20131 [Blumeria graminis f. sp. tritici]